MDGPIETSSISTMMPKFCKVRLMIVVLPLISPAPGLPVSRSRSDKGGGSKVFDRRRVSLPIKAPKPSSPLGSPPDGEAGPTSKSLVGKGATFDSGSGGKGKTLGTESKGLNFPTFLKHRQTR